MSAYVLVKLPATFERTLEIWHSKVPRIVLHDILPTHTINDFHWRHKNDIYVHIAQWKDPTTIQPTTLYCPLDSLFSQLGPVVLWINLWNLKMTRRRFMKAQVSDSGGIYSAEQGICRWVQRGLQVWADVFLCVCVVWQRGLQHFFNHLNVIKCDLVVAKLK